MRTPVTSGATRYTQLHAQKDKQSTCIYLYTAIMAETVGLVGISRTQGLHEPTISPKKTERSCCQDKHRTREEPSYACACCTQECLYVNMHTYRKLQRVHGVHCSDTFFSAENAGFHRCRLTDNSHHHSARPPITLEDSLLGHWCLPGFLPAPTALQFAFCIPNITLLTCRPWVSNVGMRN